MISENINWYDIDNVYSGGPMLREIATVIHSNDYANNTTGKLSNSFNISRSIKTINDINRGIGPNSSALVFGHCTWSPNQLQNEIDRDVWIVSDYDEDLMFPNQARDDTWEEALENHIDRSTKKIIDKI